MQFIGSKITIGDVEKVLKLPKQSEYVPSCYRKYAFISLQLHFYIMFNKALLFEI